VDLSRVTLRPIAPDEDDGFQQLLEQHHYLGSIPKIGQTLRYVAQYDGAWVAVLSFSASSLKCAARNQWIGWDAVEKQIRSWSFYSGGGFGEAAWTKDGNKWTLKVTARTAAGNKVTATNLVTKSDDDHMTWQITKLTVDGESVPDFKPVKLKRVKPAQP